MSLPRCYTVNFTPTSVTVAVDLIAIVAVTNIPIAVRAIRVWQTSDVGDAQDEVITLNLVRGNTTAGSGGAAATPVLKGPKAAAVSFTARAGDTTAASAGTAVIPYSTGWNVRNPFEITFTEDQMVSTDAVTGFLVLRFGAAPADAITVAASVDVAELY
jgi:hypothetical protein